MTASGLFIWKINRDVRATSGNRLNKFMKKWSKKVDAVTEHAKVVTGLFTCKGLTF